MNVSRLQFALFTLMAWGTFFLFTSIGVAGIEAQTCERRVERWVRLNPKPQGLACEVVVTQKNQQTTTDKSLWRANHHTQYCQSKLEFHAQKLKNLGWTCEEKGYSNWYCYQKSEHRIELSWVNEETQLPCQVSVRRSEEGFSLEHQFWRAKNQRSYCQNKFTTYLQNKTEEGWSCSGTTQSTKLVEAPRASGKEEAKETPIEKENDEVEPDDSERKTASESLTHEQKTSKNDFLFLQVEPVLNFSRIDAVDTSGAAAAVASKGLNVGASLSFEARLKPSWSIYGSFSGVHSRLQSRSVNGDLKKGDQFLWGTAFGIRNQTNRDLVLGTEIGLSRQPFLTLDSSNVLAIEAVNVPEFNIRGQWRLLQGSSIDWGTEVKVGYLFPASSDLVSARSGFQYRLGFLGETTVRNLPVQAQFYFQKRIQKTSLLDWSTKELGFLLSINLELF